MRLSSGKDMELPSLRKPLSATMLEDRLLDRLVIDSIYYIGVTVNLVM